MYIYLLRLYPVSLGKSCNNNLHSKVLMYHILFLDSKRVSKDNSKTTNTYYFIQHNAGQDIYYGHVTHQDEKNQALIADCLLGVGAASSVFVCSSSSSSESCLDSESGMGANGSVAAASFLSTLLSLDVITELILTFCAGKPCFSP